MNLEMAVWGAVNFFQNFSHTYVSRARSSGSLWRHFKAAVFSNTIYIVGLSMMFGKSFEYISGKHGRLLQAEYCLYYSVFTIAGSIMAHHWAQKSEKGKTAVGFNKAYVQITTEEWASIKERIEAIEHTTPASDQPSFGDNMNAGTYRVMTKPMEPNANGSHWELATDITFNSMEAARSWIMRGVVTKTLDTERIYMPMTAAEAQAALGPGCKFHTAL